MWFLLLACAPEPMPLPTVAAAEALHDRSLAPPLYRRLYDFAFLPEVQSKEQRVRLRIWLRGMDFDRYQLELLAELHGRVSRERNEVTRRQEEIVRAVEPQAGAVYDRIWAAMDAGASHEELGRLGEGLESLRGREAELLELRARSVRTLFEIEKPFLGTLSPGQEARFTDALFLLRHRLDPYANPGDFNALVGPVYVAGDFGTLSRTTYDPNEDHLNIGGLWSEEPESLTAHFPDARREVLLYMVLLEPELPEAIRAELQHAPAAGQGGNPPQVAAPAGEAVPPDAPGVPVEPAPGQPGDPPPAVVGDPPPAPAGEPLAPGDPGAPVPVRPPDPPPGVPSEPPPGG